MIPGATVIIGGAGRGPFEGRVLIVTDVAMTVRVDDHRTVILRRDPASTTPDQWRLGGLPVSVKAVAQRSADFAERLAKVQKKADLLESLRRARPAAPMSPKEARAALKKLGCSICGKPPAEHDDEKCRKEYES